MSDAELSQRLQAIWYGSKPPPWPLRVLARAFGWVVAVRNSAYARGWLSVKRLPRPVIVVGNLSVGGSGKTPLVIWLSERLRAQGLHPGIVLRGYGGSAETLPQPTTVSIDSDVAVVGDEALLLRRRTGVPVVVGRDRVRAGQRLVEQGVDVVIADDGLQHLRLGRDFEIAVIDRARGMGNGWLLPAGPLREAAARLRSVNAVVVNGAVGASAALAAVGAAANGVAANGVAANGVVANGVVANGVVASHGPLPDAILQVTMQLLGGQVRPLVSAGGTGVSRALSEFARQRVHAVAGIGNPPRFFLMLRAAGVDVIPHAFADHHRYAAADLDFGDNLPVLMTEKDAVKCTAFARPNWWYVAVGVQIEPAAAAALIGAIMRRIAVTK